jgi:tetratricopeptide (TPR) repeat protein
MSRHLLLFALWILGATAPLPAGVGEAAYERGDFVGALQTWRAQAEADGVTAELLSAVGNAEWKLGHKGRAMVCWERALLLSPRDPVALAGIKHALGAGGTDRPTQTWSENYAAFLGADLWLILGAIGFWGTLLAVLVPKLRRQPMGDWTQRILITSATLFALSIPGLYGAYTLASRAVVRRTDVPVKLTPTVLGESLNGTAEGDVLRTGRKLNGHTYVTSADGKGGWMKSTELEPIWGGALPVNLDQPRAP